MWIHRVLLILKLEALKLFFFSKDAEELRFIKKEGKKGRDP
jgi:hypothetical protein